MPPVIPHLQVDALLCEAATRMQDLHGCRPDVCGYSCVWSNTVVNGKHTRAEWMQAQCRLVPLVP